MMSPHRAARAGGGEGTTHILFDLDETLYPPDSGLFRQVGRRIHRYICETLHLEPEPARKLQKEYWRRYGTSLYGLMQVHGIDPDPFLAYVHDVPIEDHLSAEPRLRALLESLPPHRHIFSNGPVEYVRRVLGALDVGDLFEEIFDIRRSGYVPKPNDAPYDRVMADLAGAGNRWILIEDAAKNLPPARARGWGTIWLRSTASWLAGAFGATPVDETTVEADIIIDDLEEVGAALEQLGDGSR
jgi:putative hydrolase of the HAD superfamily